MDEKLKPLYEKIEEEKQIRENKLNHLEREINTLENIHLELKTLINTNHQTNENMFQNVKNEIVNEINETFKNLN